MAPPKFFRVNISFDVLFPKKGNPEVQVKTEFKILEELLKDTRCHFEPAFKDEYSNVLLSVIPVRVFMNRSVPETHLSMSSLVLKAEKMSDVADCSLDAVNIDYLIPVEDYENSEETQFHSDDELRNNFKDLCMAGILSQLKEYVEKLSNEPDVPLEPRHFATDAKVVTALVPAEANENQCLAIIRHKFGLDDELIYGDILSDIWSPKAGCHLINPHSIVTPPEPPELINQSVAGKSATVEVAIVPGYYRYFRYNEDGFSDTGWGCAYRSLQTICSWLRMQGYTDKMEPDHRAIQKVLVDIGDKPRSFVGTKQWIGSLEVSYVLENYLGVNSRILNISSGDELEGLASQLIQHFRIEGVPIMIGGGNLAHTIIGVCLNRATGVVRYLILDPHYPAPHKATCEEEVKTVTSKGFVGWKDNSFWGKGTFHNLCLPERPRPVNRSL